MAQSYLELLKKLTNQVKTDVIPEQEREEVMSHLRALSNILWKYSD